MILLFIVLLSTYIMKDLFRALCSFDECLVIMKG